MAGTSNQAVRVSKTITPIGKTLPRNKNTGLDKKTSFKNYKMATRLKK